MIHTSWKSEYPFEGRWFTTPGGHRMHYLDEGPVSPSDPVATLCVHGNPTWSFHWRALVSASRSSRRILAPDHIGMGLSDKPRATDYPYRLRNRIDDLEALWRHAGEPVFDLVAHDWGGAIGMGLALRHPEKVRRITLLNTAAYTDPCIPRRIAVCRLGWIGRFIVRGLNGFALPAVRLASAQPGGLRGAAREGLLHPYDSWENRVAVHEFVRDIPMSPKHPSWDELQAIGDGLAAFGKGRRIQLLWGSRDFCFHEHFLWRFLEYWPHAQVERLPDVGHYVMEDAPAEACRRILSFQQA